jgi:DNA segregation ATPase FtsK/SpoIIIE, S-DNA-T family
MAKPKRNSKSNNESSKASGLYSKSITFLKDNRTHRIFGAFLLVFAIILIIAFVSHSFTWQADQDKFGKKAGQFLFTQNGKSSNLLGRLGAFLAYFFIEDGFGIAAYLIPVFLIALGLNLFSASKIFNTPKLFLICLLGLPTIALVASYFFINYKYSYGGVVGDVLYEWLEKFLGRIGLFLLFLIPIVAYLIWKFNYTLSLPKINLKSLNKNAAEEDAALFIEPNTKKETQNIAPITNISALVNETALANNEALNKPKINISQPSDNVLFEINPGNTIAPVSSNKPNISADEFPLTMNHLPLGNQEEPNSILNIYEPKEPILAPEVSTNIAQEDDVPLTINTDPINTINQESTDNINGEQEKKAPYDPALELRNYKYPTIDLLENHGSEQIIQDPTELENYKNQIINTLKTYDIAIQKIAATVGPTVTLYEIVPAPGIRISRIKNLEDDIALSLAALGIRIIAPIPGRGTIGIEVPNVRKTVVSMRTLIASDKFNNNNYNLPIALGKRIDNENFIVDLTTMPHLLMAGATGQGKSVGLNAILVSLLYKKHPSQLKFVLVDPKKVELNIYKLIEQHFLAKLPNEEEAIITDTKKVVNTLNALCIEMDNRYDLLKDASCRNIKEYNDKFIARKLNPQKGHQYLPFLVLVVDEFADLIMTAGKEVEMPIARLAQLARAVGIHLIIATQRPSVNIITGTIKANFPARIAFKVSSKIDSRTILDAGGAEQLIGKGDMLISYNGELSRLQCAFVDTPEVEKITEFIGYQEGYPQPFLLPEYVDEKEKEAKDFDVSDQDELFEQAARLIVQNQLGSTSLIQRRMKLGYNRAGRIMEQLEARGIVGPAQGSKPREVYVKTEIDLMELLTKL